MGFSLSSAETALLGLLAEQPRHGYDLDALIEARGLRRWTEIGFSSIYFLLKKLERKGLLARASADGGAKAKKLFGITPAGRDALRDQALQMIAVPCPTHSPVLVGMANWPAFKRSAGLAALRERSRTLREEQARLLALREAQQPLPDFVDALFAFGLATMTAELAWIEETLMRLEKGDGEN